MSLLLATLEGEVVAETNLHGRKVRRPRGRRVIFPDELPEVIEEKAPERQIVVVIGAEKALERVNTARREIARLDAELLANSQRKAALASLEQQYADAIAALHQAQEAERAILARIRDDEEVWLLAA